MSLFVSCMDKHFEKLKVLKISRNKIGIQGAKALSDCFKHMKALSVLDLSHDEIGDQGIELLSQELC